MSGVVKKKNSFMNKTFSVKAQVSTEGNFDKERVKNIVKEVQKSYAQFEKGQIDQRGLKKVIVDDLKIPSNNFDELMKSAKEDNKDFKSIIRSLGLTKKPTYYPAFSPEDIRNSTTLKYPRYIKQKATNTLKTPMHTEKNFFNSLETEHTEDRSAGLKDLVNKFVKGYIDPKSFENELSKNNINPKIEEVNKYIRAYGTGPINYSELMKNVLKYQGDKYANDPDKIQHKMRTLSSFEHQKLDGEGADDGIMVIRNGDPVLIKKRKKVDNNPNLISSKNVFEWDANEGLLLSNAQTEESKNTEPKSKKTKFVINGRVYHQENDTNALLNPKKKVTPYPENGNILEWDESKSFRKGHSVDLGDTKPSTFKRRDPNATSLKAVEAEEPKIIKRVNINLKESSDNTLKFK